MRILQVITDTDRRGAQVFATDLGAAMVDRGHDVRTVALAPGKAQPPLDVEVLGSSRRGVHTLRSLRRMMRDVDVTIAHGSATGAACALAGIGPGRPFVYRQISDTRFWANTLRRRVRVSAYLRMARRIVALSEGAKTDLVDHLKLPATRIVVVPNGVPVKDFRVATDAERSAARATLGLPADGFVATYIGALVPEKGVDTAIEALTGGDVTLMIAGSGPDEGRLKALPGASSSNVHFVGGLDRPITAYWASDVVLLPSRGGDSMPATLIEAGFCGIPSVSTDIGSITDIVVDDSTGVIVPPNDPDRLHNAVLSLRDDLKRRRRLGDAARKHCLGLFEIGVVADAWLEAIAPPA